MEKCCQAARQRGREERQGAGAEREPPVFAALKAAQEAGDTEKLNKYSALLYAQAQLIEGLPVDDPAAYAEAVCSLMK